MVSYPVIRDDIMENFLKTADLGKVITLGESNWIERSEEIARLKTLESYILTDYNQARQECLDAISQARPDPSGPVMGTKFNRTQLEEARQNLNNVWKKGYKPFLNRIKQLHGEREDSSSERKTKNDVNKALSVEGDTVQNMSIKLGEVIHLVMKAIQEEAAPPHREVNLPDLRHFLDNSRKFKSCSDLQPDKLTAEFKPDRMREWKGQFKEWHSASGFGNAPPSTQFSYFAKVIDEDVKTRLSISRDKVQENEVYLFPEQAEANGEDPKESVWSKLDALFEKLHPLTKTRFELLDGVKEPGETIPKLQERITADVHSAQLENLTKDQ